MILLFCLLYVYIVGNSDDGLLLQLFNNIFLLNYKIWNQILQIISEKNKQRKYQKRTAMEYKDDRRQDDFVTGMIVIIVNRKLILLLKDCNSETTKTKIDHSVKLSAFVRGLALIPVMKRLLMLFLGLLFVFLCLFLFLSLFIMNKVSCCVVQSSSIFLLFLFRLIRQSNFKCLGKNYRSLEYFQSNSKS